MTGMSVFFGEYGMLFKTIYGPSEKYLQSGMD